MSETSAGRRHGLAAVLLCAAVSALGVALAPVLTTPAGADAGTAVASPAETTAETATATTTPAEPTETPPATTTPTTRTDTPTATVPPTMTPTATSTPSAAPTATPSAGAVTVEHAVLRWGMTNESHNRAFAPHTFNFFSAGLLPDPGRGGVTITQEQWQQSDGDVAIEKWDGSSWLPATWPGLSTDSAGNPLGSPTSGTFSNHSFVFGAGTGTVDAAAGTAQISWDGDVSVLYYSGMSFFHLSDPVLDVRGGAGEVRATLRGYASSQSDPDVWEAVPAQTVTIATLPQVDLSDLRGLVTTPAYAGVRVSGVPQATTGAHVGSFPQSFVTYLDRLGAAAFWYSSGASTDAFKVALPLTVSYDPAAPVTAGTAWQEATDAPAEVTNSAPPPPTAGVPAGLGASVAAPPLAVGAAPAAGLPPTSAVAGTALLARPPTSLRLAAASPSSAASSSSRLWWAGGTLLLLAALTLLVPPGRSGVRIPSRTTRDAPASP